MMEMFSLSKKELRRLEVLTRVDAGLLSAQEAAELLDLSLRQVRRLLAAMREGGAAALAHGNRSRTPAHKVAEETRKQVVELALTKYQGYNHQHLSEKLEDEGIKISRSTLRRILLFVGLKSPKKRRSKKHRQRRERYSQEGMLVQIDGSPHDWLEGRGPWLSLIIGVDDATGKILGAVFRDHEDAQGYFLLVEQIVRQYGVPMALYHDQHGIFVRSEGQKETIDEQLSGKRELTQFGRLLEELGIGSVRARSPQAKGRVERAFQTLQDRLVKALREAGAKTLLEADSVLEGFVREYNLRFAVEPADKEKAYRPIDKGLRLEEVFCFKYVRVVGSDNTVRFDKKRLQLLQSKVHPNLARQRVEVHERLDGSLAVYYQGECLATAEAPKEASALRARGGPRVKPKTKAAPDSTPNQPVEKSEVEAPTEAATKAPSDRRVQGNVPMPSQIDKRTGEPVDRTLTPAPNHPWRKSIKRPRMTDSLNA